jgi:hypothetical protein
LLGLLVLDRPDLLDALRLLPVNFSIGDAYDAVFQGGIGCCLTNRRPLCFSSQSKQS